MLGSNKNNSKAATHVASSRCDLKLPTTITLCDFFANCSVEKPRKNAKKQWKKQTEKVNGVGDELKKEAETWNGYHEEDKLHRVLPWGKQEVELSHLKKKKEWRLNGVQGESKQKQLPQLAKEQAENFHGGTKEEAYPCNKDQAKLLNAINGVAKKEKIDSLSKKQAQKLSEDQLPYLPKKQADQLNGFHGVTKQEQASPFPNGCASPKDLPKLTIARPPTQVSHATRRSSHRTVKSCPRIPTPCRKVPPELQHVHAMTSAEFRSDYAAHLETMRTRQKDQQHMRYFEASIEENLHLFKGRNILVLSCGTGTLALMAARAGAAHVYALDHSNVTDYAQLVVKENHMEHIITVLHGRVKEIKKLPKVDGIICNWMGYSLLYESELLQLLQARDRWLKSGGFILPDLASLYLVGAAETQLKNERCDWWLGVYGFNMNAMRRYALSEPRYARVKGEHLLTQAQRILSLNLLTATLEDLQIDRSICLQVQQEGSFECFVLYFDVKWSRAHEPLLLCCNPWRNHPQLKSLWLQTLLFVDHPFVMRRGKRYWGHLQFKSLREYPHLDMQHMRIEIEFFEGTDQQGVLCNPLLHKTWLMLPHFQSTQEVDSCQDKLLPTLRSYD